MPRYVLIKVLEYSELPKKTQERLRAEAKEDDSEIRCNDVSEDIKYRLERYGLPHKDIGWSLSSCQGDGVAFYGSVDEDALLKGSPKLTDLAALVAFVRAEEGVDLSIGISRNEFGHHYSHARTMDVEITVESVPNRLYDLEPGDERHKLISDWENLMQDKRKRAEEELTSFVREVSHELEKMGYKMLEAEVTEEDMLSRTDGDYYFENGHQLCGSARPVELPTTIRLTNLTLDWHLDTGVFRAAKHIKGEQMFSAEISGEPGAYQLRYRMSQQKEGLEHWTVTTSPCLAQITEFAEAAFAQCQDTLKKETEHAKSV